MNIDAENELEIMAKFQLARLDNIIEKKKKEEEATKQHQRDFEKVNKIRWYYSTFYDIKSMVLSMAGYVGHAITIGCQMIPPLRAAIRGFGIMLDLVEIIFVSQETLNRKAIKIANNFIANTATLAAFVLAFNPVTAPIGAALLAASSVVNMVKESIFWYKNSRDLNKAKDEFANAPTEKAKEKVNQLQEARNEARKNFFYSALSCVAAIVAVGVIAINPISLMVAAFVVSVGVIAVVGIQSYSKKEVVQNKDSITPKEQMHPLYLKKFNLKYSDSFMKTQRG